MDKILLSNKTICKYAAAIVLVLILSYALESAVNTKAYIERECDYTLNAAKGQIEYRVEESINLLSALAAREEYADPSLPIMEKVTSLESVNEYMGYMMIRYVDADINVYSQRGKTSLASRDYMQRLFTNGEAQVTDSFAAGADGVTLNYTVAVPMYFDGEISGCLFCAIYFDDIQGLLTTAARAEGMEVTVLGSKNQMMSATDTLHYGESYLNYLHGAIVLGDTKNQIEENMLAGESGAFWMMQVPSISYAMYSNIENTSWSVVATIGFWGVFWIIFLDGLLTLGASILLIGVTAGLMGHYIPSQSSRIQALMDAIGRLENRLHLDRKADSHDFQRMLQLTNEGLTDSLTGVATRPVFISQIERRLSGVPMGTFAALCFIDLDDLKKLNDTLGHVAGDTALREIGFILREYEKKYDGLVGRYGGDEFILLLVGLRDMYELRALLEEISERLKFSLPELGDGVGVNCSIGVAVWDDEMSYDELLMQADAALYHIKHSGKGTYEIYKSGEQK